MNRAITVLCTLVPSVVLAPAAFAAPPSPADANRVVEYYYSDAGAPVLMNFKLCSGVYEEGPDKNNCLEELDPKSIEQGTDVYIWMKFLVPRDAKASILTQLNHKGITRKTFNRDLDGAIRYRTWHTTQFESPGQWEVAVFHEGVNDVEKLQSITVNVK
ncbi:MAG TPA: hypothetical protein VKA50_09350 [Gammaproteobacteria bacterium]|nr:hypothetical protein [Gammaproteobacteria bacterium]